MRKGKECERVYGKGCGKKFEKKPFNIRKKNKIAGIKNESATGQGNACNRRNNNDANGTASAGNTIAYRTACDSGIPLYGAQIRRPEGKNRKAKGKGRAKAERRKKASRKKINFF